MWESKLLGDLCSFQAGGAFPRSEQGHVSGDYPFIKVSDMTLPENSKRIVEANNWVSIDAAERMRLKLVPAGAVAFAKIGEGLKAERLRQITRPTAMDNNMMAAVPMPAKVDERFLLYLIESVNIASWAQGSALPYLSQTVLSEIPVRVPGLPEQRAIAAALGALDDKIESNRRAAETLGTLIGALFTQTTSGPAISYAPLGEITSVVKGRSYKSAELEESSTALVTLKSIDRNGGYKGDGLKPYTGPYRAEQVVHPGEIVVAQTDLTQGAEVVGRGVRVPQSTKYDTLVASLDLAIVRPERGMPVEYLFGLLSSEAFRQHCRNHVTGTTVLHLAKDAIPTWEAPIVSFAEQVRFAKTARTLLARMDALFEENDRLVALRDSLLPELLSGRIRVPAEGVAA